MSNQTMQQHDGAQPGDVRQSDPTSGNSTGDGREAATPWTRIAGLVLGVAALLLVVGSAFSWPAVNSGPHQVPLGVVAPGGAAEQLVPRLAAAAGEDAFDVQPLADRAAAEQAIADREIYGAVVLDPAGGEMLTASAASPAIAQALTQLAANVPAEAGGPLQVSELAPLPADDPRGAGFATAVLPLVIAGIIAGAASALAVEGGRGRQLTAMLALVATAGLVLAGVSQLWLGSLEGSYWANAGVLALGAAAVGAVVLGLVRLIGMPGVGLTALVMVLLGSPLSGAATGPEMLPAGWGALGQLLPPGATATALRSVAWFDGAGSGQAFLVLGCWLAAGLVLLLVPQRHVRTT
ncbi:ABC transporter permease [Ornithinimicrobium sp. F0845]|uniref:ABC transporter permease n=1 Tax=Ornithinimicrobium sp. F0845 TaxID=2926412 RepID=UPI001FF1EBC6|nr:ABC transporter permease [Ornithinimicrobium sp. F0845]MCK0111736.1 ABC transporter permease [Ornithinimicrobium sp. F0845]